MPVLVFDAASELRNATRGLHERIDRSMSRLDLGDRQDYSTLLLIHGRVVPAMECALDAGGVWTGWSPRAPLLLADMRSLGIAPPPASVISCGKTDAERWGLQYVLEGSKLGGAVLERQIAPSFPRLYFAAARTDGAWRRFKMELQVAAAQAGSDWWALAIDAARGAFRHFETASSSELESARG